MSTIPQGKPIGLAILLCDQIITEQGTNKKTIVGTFNQISSSKLPILFPTISIFASVHGGSGTYQAKLKISREDSEGRPQIFFEASGPLKLETPLHFVELHFKIVNALFHHAGIYTVEFFCDDELVLYRPLTVTLLQGPPPPSQVSLPPPEKP